MADHKAFGTPFCDGQPDAVKGTGPSGDCGVPEEGFPQPEKCCSKGVAISGTVYRKKCPFCSIWTSLPDGASLEVSHIFECTLYGYGKRIKE